LLTIGEVARVTGKAASSIRYYGQIGLIPASLAAGSTAAFAGAAGQGTGSRL